MNNDILSQFHNNTLQQMANVQNNNDQMSQAAQGGNGAPASPDFVTNAQIASDNAKQAQQPAPTQPAQQDQPDGNGGNWFTKALPTIGSIAAPILGALLAPETGGASLLAGLALAGGGSAAGKLGENAIEGKSDLGSGVADSAVSGSVGQLAGGAAGKLLGAGAKALGGVAEKGIAGKAIEKGAIDNVESQQAMNNAYGPLKTAFKQNNNFDDNMKLAQNLGVDHLNPQALSTTSTHAGDIYNGVINDALAKSGGVDTSGLTDMLKTSIAKNAGTLGSLDPVALKKGLIGPNSSKANTLYQQVQGELGGLFNQPSADPIALRDAIGKIGGMVGDAKPGISSVTGAIDPAQKAMHQTLGDIYGNLKDMLYNRPGVVDTIKNLQGNILPEDVGSNAALADHINSTLTNSQHPQDIIDSLRQFTQMGNIGREGASLAQDSARPGVLNAAKQAVPELSTAADAIPLSKTGMIAGLANKVLGAAGNGGATSQVASKLADMLTSASKIAPNMTNAGLIGTIGGQVVAGAPNYQQAAGTGTMVNSLNVANPATGNPISDIMGSNAPGADAAKLALVSSYFTPNWNGGGATANPQAIADFSKHQQASSEVQAQVNNYIHALNAAGGAQGAVPGLLAQLGGAMTGGPVAGLDAQRQQLEASLQTLYGHHIALPTTMLNQQAANSVLGQLGNTLNASSGF